LSLLSKIYGDSIVKKNGRRRRKESRLNKNKGLIELVRKNA